MNKRFLWLLVLCIATCTLLACADSTATGVTPTTPGPTPTIQQRIQALVDSNATLDDKATSSYDGHAVTVTVTLSEAFDNNGYQLAIRSNCFAINKALWQNVHGLDSVEIDFLGPLVDAYGNNSIGGMGMCQLTATTEKLFNWNNLDADQAWSDYDQTGYANAIQ